MPRGLLTFALRVTVVFTMAVVIIPFVILKNAAVPVFIIKNNLRTVGISRERYSEP